MPTILLTGLPRSGTTLTCALLNRCPDTVALAEPIQLGQHGDRARALGQIETFVSETRHSALTRGVVTSKHIDGVVPDNTVGRVAPGARLRGVAVSHGEIAVDKPLSDDFHLLIKHPAEFTALADVLQAQYPLYAIVRHPLAVLAAWQTVDMPVQRGRMPMLETFTPGLAARLDAISNPLKRQVALMDWLLSVYEGFPANRVLRYEDTTADPAASLAPLTPHSADLRPLPAYDPASRYAHLDLGGLAAELLPIRRRIERFYPDFEASLEPFLAQSS
jgi:hypothetical protein